MQTILKIELKKLGYTKSSIVDKRKDQESYKATLQQILPRRSHISKPKKSPQQFAKVDFVVQQRNGSKFLRVVLKK